MSRILLIILLNLPLAVFLSAEGNDSIQEMLEPVIIFPTNTFTERTTSSTATIGKEELLSHPQYSLVAVVNTIPGIRMEERSPGSYRFSIRGSLLRSPFGVRNIRFYLSDFPLTDAGGNTYLNCLDISDISSIHIIKGPESSLYGANTGGVVVIDPVDGTSPDSLSTHIMLQGGSRGYFHEGISLKKKFNNYTFHFRQAYQRYNGYRENSAMQRHYLQSHQQWQYDKRGLIKWLFLYADLQYQTPGGLTLEEYQSDPGSARPASGVLPGAVEQKAGIFNRTFLTGLSHHRQFSSRIYHIVALTISGTQFQNPFITNYEKRKEYTSGVRTYADFRLSDKNNIKTSLRTGAEWQSTFGKIYNHVNKGGIRDSLKVADRLVASQSFIYSRLSVDFSHKLLIEASASLNLFSYRYKNLFPIEGDETRPVRFNPQVRPRVALSYKPISQLVLRASISTGYSPPNIAEVRSSDNKINEDLQEEKGFNVEMGLLVADKRDIWNLQVSAYYFRLRNAIVRRINEDNSDYFVNAGGTRQPGVEAALKIHALNTEVGLFRRLTILSNVSCSFYKFVNYRYGNADYSGNRLTGVPRVTFLQAINITLPGEINFYIQYYYIQGFPLNDANSVSSEAAHLLQARAEWKKYFHQFGMSVFLGGDNLLNRKYSLGYDLNAFGGRYYNAAAPINFYFGINAFL